MIVSTGMRTDIPAFYSRWLMERIGDGYVLVRNPAWPRLVTRYRLDPGVVDVLTFCSKHPGPLLPYLPALRRDGWRMFWYVTITPYGRDLEPGVPDKAEVVDEFRRLSSLVGADAVGWRYDPVLVSPAYPAAFHEQAFASLAGALDGYTHIATFSFIDLYRNVRRNFPSACEVDEATQERLARSFALSGAAHGMRVHACFERAALAGCGVDVGGCQSRSMLERAAGVRLSPHGDGNTARKGCSCLLGHDIGAYDTCRHFCAYCYANEGREQVLATVRRHDDRSPLLVGWPEAGDEIRDAKQESWINPQPSLF